MTKTDSLNIRKSEYTDPDGSSSQCDKLRSRNKFFNY